MKALKIFLAGGAALAALTVAAPASAQYYPGYGSGYGSPYGSGYGSPYGSPYGSGYGYGSPYGYGSGGGIIGQVLSTVIGGGVGYNNGQNMNPLDRYGPQGRMAINQCMGAVQQRLSASYGAQAGYGYGYAQSGARVLGVSDVDRRSNGGLSVRGVANSGRTMAYGYNGGGQVDLTFKCKTDASGYIVDIDIEQAASVYGTSQAPAYTPYNTDYSQYGYRRY